MYLSRCRCTESFPPGGPHTYTFTGPCVVTGKDFSVTVPAEGLFAYNHGAHVQDAFPNLSPDQREFIISGTSPEGWKEIFGDEE